MLQAVATPFVHVVQAAHGAAPVATLKVEPAAHGALHTVSAVAVHAVLTPFSHVAQAAHGAAPVATLKVEPVVHSAMAIVASILPNANVVSSNTSTLKTMSYGLVVRS